jgi:hypothetical protein
LSELKITARVGRRRKQHEYLECEALNCEAIVRTNLRIGGSYEKENKEE